jgi:hypothetical protein
VEVDSLGSAGRARQAIIDIKSDQITLRRLS